MLEQAGERSPSEARQGGSDRPEKEAPSLLGRSGRRFWRATGLAALGLVAALVAVAALRPSNGVSTSVASSGEAAIGGPFHLIDDTGRPVDQHVLDGRWSAVFFGYTNCPDTCPATLQALNAAAQQLGGARGRFQVVFISVDPARDTPAQMRLYDTSQGYPAGGLRGLTGTPSQVASVAGEYHAFYKAGTGPGYAVQHSAAIYLMDPQGRFVKPLDETQPPSALATQIKEAMGV
ncbi:SCO family protein [Caulobacter sp. S45]|uniref:SCO family protein n=1 Tax=Caulobacter sp. S45 TaxID=1641861 RepID=UPI001576D905|nr:SCO family protein [Caulobacter sp. S45]